MDFKPAFDIVSQLVGIQETIERNCPPDFVQPHRRLDHQFRAYQVKDPNIQGRFNAAQEREVYLFNDIILIMKIFRQDVSQGRTLEVLARYDIKNLEKPENVQGNVLKFQEIFVTPTSGIKTFLYPNLFLDFVNAKNLSKFQAEFKNSWNEVEDVKKLLDPRLRASRSESGLPNMHRPLDPNRRSVSSQSLPVMGRRPSVRSAAGSSNASSSSNSPQPSRVMACMVYN